MIFAAFWPQIPLIFPARCARRNASFPYSFAMVSLWIAYGLPMALLWLSYGFPIDSQSKAKPGPHRLAQALGSMFIVENKKGGGDASGQKP